MNRLSRFKSSLVLGAVFIAGAAVATPALYVTSQIYSRVTVTDFHATGKNDNGWEVKLKAKGASDIVTQKIVIQPGGHAGWHGHPGAHFGSVQAGTLTLYDADDCIPQVFPAGTGFVDSADGHHIARNEGSVPVELWVTYVLPAGSGLRIDKPNPGTCGF